MKKIMIVLNAIVYNRGSEALVRGLSSIIKDKYGDDVQLSLVSSESNFDETVNIPEIGFYIKKSNYKAKSIMDYIVKVFAKLNLLNIVVRLKYSKLLKAAKKQDLIIMIGADNYDITYGLQASMNALHTYLKKHDIKMLLYDCSIDQRDITVLLKNDLINFDAITVRETISLENMESITDSVHLYPDPAFAMNNKKIDLPDIFDNRKIVGINASNLITNHKYGSNAEIIIQAYIELIKYIINTTDYGIVLIPHVMKNADLSTLSIIYKEFTGSDRVYLIENEKLNARELKYIISKCKFFIGARTHSTIAAYSSKVPTLVLGYSVKSKGIAKDLFGTYDKYVLPVSELDNNQYLVDGFKWLLKNENNIKEILNDKMDKYIEDSKKVIEIIDELLK